MQLYEIERCGTELDINAILARMAKVFRSDLFFKHQVKSELRLAKNLPTYKGSRQGHRSSHLPPLPERHNSPQGFAKEGIDS